jgi:hypothetical protein
MTDQALYFQKFLIGLITTILIETIILIISVRIILKVGKEQLSHSLLIFTGIICSFATVPYLWFVLPFYFRTKPYYLFFIVGEVSVTLIESIIIYFVLRLDYKRSLLVSVLCNAISLVFGLIFLR